MYVNIESRSSPFIGCHNLGPPVMKYLAFQLLKTYLWCYYNWNI